MIGWNVQGEEMVMLEIFVHDCQECFDTGVLDPALSQGSQEGAGRVSL